MDELVEHIRKFWEKMDPKVRNGVLTYIVTFLVTKLAIPLDPILEQAINGGVAYLVSYHTPNLTTKVREQLKDTPLAEVLDDAEEVVDVPASPHVPKTLRIGVKL